ncbi:FixH family protein [bacterium SCSIO 12741]|nr:FixH family protein [bacterium SCSIO 12741]
MKLNWGTGITIAIVAFMCFILYLVISISSVSTDLYAEDYYQQEIEYQNRIDQKKNSNPYQDQWKVKATAQEVSLEMPAAITSGDIQGKVQFYRADDASMDRLFDLKLNNQRQTFDRTAFSSGRYTVKVEWTHQEVPYFLEKDIYIP